MVKHSYYFHGYF